MQGITNSKKKLFDLLFIKYYKPLFYFALNICGDKVVAEEAVQKTFITVWQKMDTPYDENSINDRLLFTYTKNNVIDEIRLNNTRRKYEENAIANMDLNYEQFPDEKIVVKSIIETAINKLPKKAKEVFKLAKQDGLSIQEIATYLAISIKTVENQITIAHKKLRIYLEPYKNLL